MIIELANQKIEISHLHPFLESYCEAYCCDSDRVDFSVQVTQEDIDFERDKSAREDMKNGNAVRFFSDPYLETLAAYRKIAEIMPDHDTFLFHGSAVCVDGVGYLFAGPSGTGKSTHTGLWREMLGDAALMVNDDKPLIRISEDSAVVFGTPWDGKHRLSNRICVPLRAVCVLEQAAENRIWEIPVSEAFPVLLQQTYRPADVSALQKTLMLLERFCGTVRFYHMQCNMDISAAELSYQTMREAGV